MIKEVSILDRNKIEWRFIIIVLLLIPSIYIIRRHFGLVELFDSVFPENFKRISDNQFFVSAWSSIVILHWTNLILVIIILRIKNISLTNIGYKLNGKQTLILIGLLVLIGLFLYFIRLKLDFSIGRLFGYELPYAFDTKGELLFCIVIAISAGFCEEITFRGFGIMALQKQRLPLLISIVIPLISWLVIHKITDFSYFLILIFGGLLYSTYFIWKKDIVFPIVLHSLIDLTLIII